MKILLLLSFLIFLLFSCSTIDKQEVIFNSEPQGVLIKINGKIITKTPSSIRIDKKSIKSIIFEIKGYKTTEINFDDNTGGIDETNLVDSENQYFIRMVKER